MISHHKKIFQKIPENIEKKFTIIFILSLAYH